MKMVCCSLKYPSDDMQIDYTEFSTNEHISFIGIVVLCIADATVYTHISN